MSKTEQQRLEETIALYDTGAATFADNTQDATTYVSRYNDFLAYLPTGAQILDIGCGAGRDMKYFLDAGYKVKGVDLSQGMLDQAINSGIDSQRLYCHDITDLSSLFPPSSIDGIWMFAVLVHMSKEIARDIIRQAINLLKPGGVVHIAVKLHEEGNPEETTKSSLSLPGIEKRYIYRKEDELVDVLQKLDCHPLDISYDIYEEQDSRLHLLARKS